MKKFISRHLQYPVEAREAGVEGTVVVKFDIDYRGKVVDTRVVSSLGYGCDEEAERVVRLLRFEVPKSRGVRVLFHKSVNIHFRKPAAADWQISYTYSGPAETPATEEGEEESGSGGYSYSIEI